MKVGQEGSGNGFQSPVDVILLTQVLSGSTRLSEDHTSAVYIFPGHVRIWEMEKGNELPVCWGLVKPLSTEDGTSRLS